MGWEGSVALRAVMVELETQYRHGEMKGREVKGGTERSYDVNLKGDVSMVNN